jgi:hypothetical protein
VWGIIIPQAEAWGKNLFVFRRYGRFYSSPDIHSNFNPGKARLAGLDKIIQDFISQVLVKNTNVTKTVQV